MRYVHFQIFSNDHVPAPLFAIRENIDANLQILSTFMKIPLSEHILCTISLLNSGSIAKTGCPKA